MDISKNKLKRKYIWRPCGYKNPYPDNTKEYRIWNKAYRYTLKILTDIDNSHLHTYEYLTGYRCVGVYVFIPDNNQSKLHIKQFEEYLNSLSKITIKKSTHQKLLDIKYSNYHGIENLKSEDEIINELLDARIPITEKK